jgi:hypothetical protein
MTIADLIEQAETIYHDDSLTDEQRYDLIFGLEIWQKIRALDYSFEWCDPDTSYEADTTAYMDALREYKEAAKYIQVGGREYQNDRWIEVKEDQMPPKMGRSLGKSAPSPPLLVYIPRLDKGTIEENGVYKGRYLHYLKEWRIEGSPSDWEVTHWMAWPAPPIKN